MYSCCVNIWWNFQSKTFIDGVVFHIYPLPSVWMHKDLVFLRIRNALYGPGDVWLHLDYVQINDLCFVLFFFIIHNVIVQYFSYSSDSLHHNQIRKSKKKSNKKILKVKLNESTITAPPKQTTTKNLWGYLEKILQTST